MGSMSSLYVRCGDDAGLLARIRSEHPGAVIEAPSAFARIALQGVEDPGKAGVLDLANRYGTEVLFILFVSTTDSFAFTHCTAGRCLRHLRYGCDEQGWWEVVEGEPEAWERQAFFDDEQQVEDIDDDDPERAEVEELFRLGRVRSGTGWPILDARESARAAAVHFRLTDWLDDWLDPVPTRHEVVTPKGEVIAIPRRSTDQKPTPLAPVVESPAPDRAGQRPAPGENPDGKPKRPWWRFWG